MLAAREIPNSTWARAGSGPWTRRAPRPTPFRACPTRSERSTPWISDLRETACDHASRLVLPGTTHSSGACPRGRPGRPDAPRYPDIECSLRLCAIHRNHDWPRAPLRRYGETAPPWVTMVSPVTDGSATARCRRHPPAGPLRREVRGHGPDRRSRPPPPGAHRPRPRRPANAGIGHEGDHDTISRRTAAGKRARERMSLPQLYLVLLIGGLVLFAGIAAVRAAGRLGLPSLLLFLALGVFARRGRARHPVRRRRPRPDARREALAVILVEGGLSTRWNDIRRHARPGRHPRHRRRGDQRPGHRRRRPPAARHGLALGPTARRDRLLHRRRRRLLGAARRCRCPAASPGWWRPSPASTTPPPSSSCSSSAPPAPCPARWRSAGRWSTRSPSASCSACCSAGAAPGRCGTSRCPPAACTRWPRSASASPRSPPPARPAPPASSPPTCPASSSATPSCRTARPPAPSPRAPPGSPRSACSSCSACSPTPATCPRRSCPASVVGLVLLLAARPISVVLCLLPFRMPWRAQAFISWAGLRGAVPIVLTTFPIVADVPGAWHVLNIVFVIVAVFTLIQGPSLTVVARRLGLAEDEQARRDRHRVRAARRARRRAAHRHHPARLPAARRRGRRAAAARALGDRADRPRPPLRLRPHARHPAARGRRAAHRHHDGRPRGHRTPAARGQPRRPPRPLVRRRRRPRAAQAHRRAAPRHRPPRHQAERRPRRPGPVPARATPRPAAPPTPGERSPSPRVRPDGAHAPRPPAALPGPQQPDGAGTTPSAQGPAREENEPPARPAGHRPG